MHCSGKTTLLSVLAHGAPVETVPTIGLNVKVFQKGKVNMKCWDIGGQAQYRSEWSRYAKGCDVVLYVVDAAAPQKMATAKRELHKLLDDGSIGSTPLLVLANKIDIHPHVGEVSYVNLFDCALRYCVDGWLNERVNDDTQMGTKEKDLVWFGFCLIYNRSTAKMDRNCHFIRFREIAEKK